MESIRKIRLLSALLCLQAYSTGIHTDVSTMQIHQMHDQGTWITELAMLIGGHLIFVSVEVGERGETQVEAVFYCS